MLDFLKQGRLAKMAVDQQSNNFLVQLWINKTKNILEREGKLDEELIFSITSEDLNKCCFVGKNDLSTYDGIIDKIWIWLFRLYRVMTIYGFPEEVLINNIIISIEHEYIHKIDSQFVGKTEYTNLDKVVAETIVMLQQGRIKGDTLWEAIENLKNIPRGFKQTSDAKT